MMDSLDSLDLDWTSLYYIVLVHLHLHFISFLSNNFNTPEVNGSA
jgi:hypothetical protein